MGLQGLIISEEMVPHLHDILISAGIKVEKENDTEENGTVTLPAKNDKKPLAMKVPKFSLNCENQKGERVTLKFSRNTLEPYDLAIELWPLPQSLWKTFVKMDKNKLVDEIIVVLKENGAKEFDNFLDKTKY